MRPSRLTLSLHKVMKAAGLSGRQPAHGFRHSAATLLLASRAVDIVAVSKRLGHATVSTTLNIYGHTDSERDRAAAGVLGEIVGV